MKNRTLKLSLAAAAIAAGLAAYGVWRPKWPWTNPPDEAAAPTSEEPPTEVVISPEKFAQMKLTSAQVTRREVREERTVPGQIDYKRVRRVELKAPVDSVIEKVLVKPGDAVERGTRLAVLISPDVGMARAEVEKNESELNKIAEPALAWDEEISRNLDDLLTFLRDNPRPQVVEREFDDKLLGNHRQAILQAYSKYVLAKKLEESAELSRKSGSLSEQAIIQRESAREVAKAQYLTICEQSRFDARLAREKSLQHKNYARRLLDVSHEKLRTLLGEFSEVARPADSAGEGTELTRFYLVAPFRGTVEQRLASDSQRVAEGTLLFAVANTELLEVSAKIREGDWQVVAEYFNGAAEGQTRYVKVVVPAVGEDREFEARVDYVGRMVDPETRAVSLVANLDNSKGEFKPGMFARIRIPAGVAKEELVVPPAALRTHNKQDFVFVEDAQEPRKFVRVDVTVGKWTPEAVTIVSGLSAGQRVVVGGAFLLKSELLLEPEEE